MTILHLMRWVTYLLKKISSALIKAVWSPNAAAVIQSVTLGDVHEVRQFATFTLQANVKQIHYFFDSRDPHQI